MSCEHHKQQELHPLMCCKVHQVEAGQLQPVRGRLTGVAFVKQNKKEPSILVHHQPAAQHSPSPSNALPLTRVPLELPMSRSVQAACSQANTACFSDTAESLIQI